MKQYNEGTKIIIKDLLILKDKVIMCGMPDYQYILMGINIVEEFVLRENPVDISNEVIDSILNENVFSQISHENKIINNIKVYSLPSSNNHKYILNGRNIQNNNEILINESFKSFFEGSEVIGRYLNIQEKYIYKGKEYIKDSYKEIVGITKDSLFTLIPVISISASTSTRGISSLENKL